VISVPTFTGKEFMIAPVVRADRVDIRDVAHGLAHVSFFPAGQAFYSMAEHSVTLSRRVPPRLARWGLLANGFAAYIGHTPESVKRILPAVDILERRLTFAIGSRFGLKPPLAPPVDVVSAEEDLFLEEITALCGGASLPSVRFLNPAMAERRFLDRWAALDELDGGAE
jgi:hypothetical protein